jgi:AcrR family transcriptional regulator
MSNDRPTAGSPPSGPDPDRHSQSPKQERALRTRELIIERAAEAFERQGYEGASLNEIIRSTGLTKGAFYHHFSSKDDLAYAVFRAKQGELAGRIREAARDRPDALEALGEMLRLRARLLVSEPALGCFLRLASELGVRCGPGSEFAASYEVPVGIMTDLVRQGQAQGVIRAELDPRAAGEAIVAAMLGTDELSKVVSGGRDLTRRTEAWLGVMIAGLAAPPGPALKRSGG